MELVEASLGLELDSDKAWGLQVNKRLAEVEILFLSDKILIIAIKAPVTMLLVRQEKVY